MTDIARPPFQPAVAVPVVRLVGDRQTDFLLFRREFPPADNRNHDSDQRRDRTTDGPGRGVAHRATTEHSESLERPDQTEHCEDQPECECSDESRSHIRILRAIR
jgi:hypothetical protein